MGYFSPAAQLYFSHSAITGGLSRFTSTSEPSGGGSKTKIHTPPLPIFRVRLVHSSQLTFAKVEGWISTRCPWLRSDVHRSGGFVRLY